MEPQNNDPKITRETVVQYQVERKVVDPLSVIRPGLGAQALINLVESRRTEGDEQEQRETWEFLKAALDEDRLSDRKLFP